MPTVVIKATAICTIVTVFFFLSSFNAYAATIYSNSQKGNDSTGDGSSTLPYKTFHKAYTSASSGDTINLKGTFTWTDTAESGDVTTSGYVIAKSLTIDGNNNASTIIQSAVTPFTADRAVFRINSGVTATLRNLTIQNGRVTTTANGGGITSFGTLTIQNAVIKNNMYQTTSSGGAGGVYAGSFSTLTVDKTTVSNNNFSGTFTGGGGIFVNQFASSFQLTNSTVNNNTATSTNTTNAYSASNPVGGISISRSVVSTLTNNTIALNTTNSHTGGLQMYLTSGATLTNNTIAYNNADSAIGGVVFLYGSGGALLHLKNNIIANNTGDGTFSDFGVPDSTAAGQITDNGYNIIEYSTNVTFSATGDHTGNHTNLDLTNVLKLNYSQNWTHTLAIGGNSVATDAGDPSNSANNGVAIPLQDQRNGIRVGLTDIGSFEYNAIQPPPKNTINKDTKCRNVSPPQPTWLKLTPGEKNGKKGMQLTWTQFFATHVNIMIDDGTGKFPWKIVKASNNGHRFLYNVAPWQKVKIKPINGCNEGDYIDFEFSQSLFPNGWFNLPFK